MQREDFPGVQPTPRKQEATGNTGSKRHSEPFPTIYKLFSSSLERGEHSSIRSKSSAKRSGKAEDVPASVSAARWSGASDDVSLLSGFRVTRVNVWSLYSAFPIIHTTFLLQHLFFLVCLAPRLADAGLLLYCFVVQIVLSASNNQPLAGSYSGQATFKAKKHKLQM